MFWTLHGLRGIKTNNKTYLSGNELAMLNERITSPDRMNRTSSSTITISGFTAVDHGGTVQCTYLDKNAKHKNTNVSLGEDVTIYCC